MIPLYNTKEMYKDFDNKSISYNDFKSVLESFNKKISDKIIEGYKFKIGHNLGTVKIIKKERKFKLNDKGNPTSAINWGESKKRKKELLEQGKELYDEKTCPNGEEWLIFFTDKYFTRWLWNKGDNNYGVHNSRIYSFKPTWTNKRSLATFVKQNKDSLFLNYHNDDI